MRMFVVSSPFMMHVAQCIIKKSKNMNNILYSWYVPNNKKHIQSYEIQKNEDYWKKIIHSDKGDLFIHLTIKNIFLYRNLLKKNAMEIKKILESNGATEVIIGNRYSPIDRQIYHVCRDLGISCSLLEDGLRSYINENKVIKKDYKYIIKKFIKKIIFREMYFLYDEEYELIFESIYTVLPEKYSIDNYKGELKEIDLNIIDNDKIAKLINFDENKNRALFLSQCISEDREVSVEQEIKLLENFIVNNIDKFDEIIIKFHPRDSKNKQNIIINKINTLGLDVKILDLGVDIPLELIIKELNINYLVGFYTSSLFYMKKIDSSINVISLLKSLTEVPSCSTRIKNIYMEVYNTFDDIVYK